MTVTRINNNFINKLNRTQINVEKIECPDITGQTLWGLLVEEKLNISSGEADIYRVKGVKRCVGKTLILKLYRRINAIKADVVKKLKEIRSPYIASIIHYGLYSDHQYVVMPYYKYPTLAQVLLSGEKFSEEELKNMIIPSVIEGLNAVHNAGILHKDLKPANLIPDNSGEHILLIDFGISTDIGNQSIVITQTGMSPLYAAPEAIQGVFHKETDYYSLGITIFELFTGYTPFQNTGLSQDEVLKIASVNKINFPQDFPEDLRKLVLGLTYRDLSHRDEIKNPNRRWGYDEVVRWLKGEQLPVPGEIDLATQLTNGFLPFSFNGKTYQTLPSLVRAMMENPNKGIKELGRGMLTHHFGYFDRERAAICYKAEEAIGKDDCKNLRIFYKLMYLLSPEIHELYFNGKIYNNFEELASYLFNIAVEVSSGNNKNLEIIDSAYKYLYGGVFNDYIDIILKSSKLAEILIRCKELTESAKLSSYYAVLIFIYAISDNKNRLVSGGKIFKSIYDIGKEIIIECNEGNINLGKCSLFSNTIEMIANGFFTVYTSLFLSDDVGYKQRFCDILHELSSNIFDIIGDYWKMFLVGYNLSGLCVFRLNNCVYKGIPDFCEKMSLLHNSDVLCYNKFVFNYKNELLFLKNIVRDDNLKIAIQIIIDKAMIAVFGKEEYVFKNSREFDNFIHRLDQSGRFRELKYLFSKYRNSLWWVDNQVWKSKSYELLNNSLIGIDRVVFGKNEHVFESPEQFKKFVEDLISSKQYKELYCFSNKYSQALKSIDECFWRNDSFSAVKIIDDNLQKIPFLKRKWYDALSNSVASEKIFVRNVSYPLRQSNDLTKIFALHPQSGEINIFGNKYPPQIGMSVILGSLQINEKSQKNIEWIIIGKDNDKALVMSRYGIKLDGYNRQDRNVWKNSDVRKYLNDYFLNTFFSKEEKNLIELISITDDDVKDRIFCLNVSEFEKFLTGSNFRKCLSLSDSKNCSWLLRYDDLDNSASYVNSNGDIYNKITSSTDNILLRPCFWVSLTIDEMERNVFEVEKERKRQEDKILLEKLLIENERRRKEEAALAEKRRIETERKRIENERLERQKTIEKDQKFRVKNLQKIRELKNSIKSRLDEINSKVFDLDKEILDITNENNSRAEPGFLGSIANGFANLSDTWETKSERRGLILEKNKLDRLSSRLDRLESLVNNSDSSLGINVKISDLLDRCSLTDNDDVEFSSAIASLEAANHHGRMLKQFNSSLGGKRYMNDADFW